MIHCLKRESVCDLSDLQLNVARPFPHNIDLFRAHRWKDGWREVVYPGARIRLLVNVGAPIP